MPTRQNGLVYCHTLTQAQAWAKQAGPGFTVRPVTPDVLVGVGDTSVKFVVAPAPVLPKYRTPCAFCGAVRDGRTMRMGNAGGLYCNLDCIEDELVDSSPDFDEDFFDMDECVCQQSNCPECFSPAGDILRSQRSADHIEPYPEETQ